MEIGIVGLGLMGASFGKTVRAKKAGTVWGADKNEDTMLKASLIGAIDGALDTEKAKTIDILIIAVYPRDFASVAKKYLPYMKKGAAVLDF